MVSLPKHKILLFCQIPVTSELQSTVYTHFLQLKAKNCRGLWLSDCGGLIMLLVIQLETTFKQIKSLSYQISFPHVQSLALLVP